MACLLFVALVVVTTWVWSSRRASRKKRQALAASLAVQIRNILERLEWEEFSADQWETPSCSWKSDLVPLEFQFQTEKLLRKLSVFGSGDRYPMDELADTLTEVLALLNYLADTVSQRDRQKARLIAWGYIWGLAEHFAASTLTAPWLQSTEWIQAMMKESLKWFKTPQDLIDAKSLLTASELAPLVAEDQSAERNNRAGFAGDAKYWASVSVDRARQLYWMSQQRPGANR